MYKYEIQGKEVHDISNFVSTLDDISPFAPLPHTGSSSGAVVVIQALVTCAPEN